MVGLPYRIGPGRRASAPGPGSGSCCALNASNNSSSSTTKPAMPTLMAGQVGRALLVFGLRIHADLWASLRVGTTCRLRVTKHFRQLVEDPSSADSQLSSH